MCVVRFRSRFSSIFLNCHRCKLIDARLPAVLTTYINDLLAKETRRGLCRSTVSVYSNKPFRLLSIPWNDHQVVKRFIF